MVLRRREPNAIRRFRVPGYPVTPLLFVASALLLVVNTVIAQPQRAVAGLAVVLLGTPAYFVWRAKSRREPVLTRPLTQEGWMLDRPLLAWAVVAVATTGCGG